MKEKENNCTCLSEEVGNEVGTNELYMVIKRTELEY
jgi:hypothetical protein